MYPVPSYAAHIWVVGDEIHLALPPIEGLRQGHTVVMPRNAKALDHLLNILRARESQKRPRTLATKASPTQWDIEQWMKAAKKAKLEAASVADIVELDFSTEEIEVKELK